MLKQIMSYFQEKLALLNINNACTITDTGGWVEYTKGREITLSKELGKITP